MPAREIVLLGDPILRQKAADVESFDDELRRLVQDMFMTMAAAEGAGLAAPQIGISQRILVAEVRGEEEKVERAALVNPTIVELGGEEDRAPEGCLSVPGVSEVVGRPYRVVVEGFDLSGELVRIEAEGLFGRVLQHEVDHLEGVLFFDRISPLKRRMLLKKYQKLRAEEAGD
jgi:peptide deformylase